MKKLVALVSALIFVLAMIGCSQQVQGNQLLLEGNVINVNVSSLPDGYNCSFNGEDAKAIIDYLANLNLYSKFKENPNEYVGGMTWVISLEYDNGDVITVYHFGNMFIRSEKGSWYRMTYDEASRFKTLLNELND